MSESTEDAPRTESVPHGLPAKITGIVFWGMVLVGFLIALFILHGRSEDILQKNVLHAKLLGAEIESWSTRHPSDPALWPQEELKELIALQQKELGFEAIQLVSGKTSIHLGSAHEDPERVTRVLNALPHPGSAIPVPTLELTVLFPNLDQAVEADRNKIMIRIGLMVLVFGLVLQHILQKILTKPFSDMVNTAITFAEGNIETRFDESRSDEFGFLSRFINEALDSTARQQSELQVALMRATQSEVELFGEKERAEVTLQAITDAVITVNGRGEILYLNPVAERMTGWVSKEAIGQKMQNVVQIISENTGETLENPACACIRQNSVESLSANQLACLIGANGERTAIHVSAAPMHNSQGGIMGAVLVCQDVSQSRNLTNQLSFQATHDPLTGLVNRREFEHRLNIAIESARIKHQTHILLFLDLDQFKVVNDTCGHVAGDQLLTQLASELESQIRKNDMLARLGGDEFAVLLEGCDNARGYQIAETLLDAVSRFRFGWEDKMFQVGVSIGLIEVTPYCNGLAEVMSAADAACYSAKDGGRNRIHVHSGGEEDEGKRGEMQWVSRIHKALEDGRFRLFRQNIIPVGGTGDASGHAEVLLRMLDEEGNIVPPMAFIPAAERYNIMSQLDRWVLRNALGWMALHPNGPDGRPQSLSINLSGQSLGDSRFLDYAVEQFLQANVAFDQVCFEVTETAAIAHLGQAKKFISTLRERGCSFALDDFGSGMSSYSYLKNLNVDYLKIDGAFVRDMVSDPVDFAMVESINRIGHVMGIKTIAEFVEDEDILSRLRELGVDYAQGYGVHKPEPL